MLDRLSIVLNIAVQVVSFSFLAFFICSMDNYCSREQLNQTSFEDCSLYT